MTRYTLRCAFLELRIFKIYNRFQKLATNREHCGNLCVIIYPVCVKIIAFLTIVRFAHVPWSRTFDFHKRTKPNIETFEISAILLLKRLLRREESFVTFDF